MPAVDSRNFLNDARAGQIRRRHWSDHYSGGANDVGRACAKMAGTIAWRYSNRARTFRILFSDRYLHCSQHLAQLAIVDLSAVGSVLIASVFQAL